MTALPSLTVTYCCSRFGNLLYKKINKMTVHIDCLTLYKCLCLSFLNHYCRKQFNSVPFCSEHQELARQLQEQTDPSHPQTTAELEQQLECLVEHLETKADHIKIVRKQLQSCKQRPRTRIHPHMAATLPVSRGGEVEVTTTVKAKATTPQSEQQHKTPSLEFLKKMKSLQNTLQRDDLSWN